MNNEISDNSEGYEEDLEDDEGASAVDALHNFSESRVPFSREDLMNAESLRTSDYKNISLDIINNLPFTMDYKQDLSRWAHRSYGKDVLLSDTSNRKSGRFTQVDSYSLALISAELDLMKRRLSMSRSDKLEPSAYTIEDDLMFVFRCVLSRTHGPKRERLINGVFRTESESIARSGAIEQKNEERKNKGFFRRNT